MSSYSLDTDTITKLLKKHPDNQPIVDRFRQELKRNSLFIVCPVVFYEVRRELVFKGATTQLSAFDSLVEALTWREFAAPVWNRPSELRSTLRAQRRSNQDADVLIAAHALEYRAVVVTGNVGHFQYTGAQVEDWSQ